MYEKIIIKINDKVFSAELNNSSIAKKINENLPIHAKVNIWGEEIYFEIPVKTRIEKGVTEVEKGDIGYWPDGACFCIFFGPTPASSGGKIIPASAVEIIGKLENPDYILLKNVKQGEKITIEKFV